MTVDDGPPIENSTEKTPIITQTNPEPSLANTSGSSSMSGTAISPDENEIDIDFILHTSTSDDQLSSSNNNTGDIGLTPEGLEVIQDAERHLPNGMFEDYGDGFGEDDNSTESETGQHLSYSERLDEQKRQVKELIDTEVKLNLIKRKGYEISYNVK